MTKQERVWDIGIGNEVIHAQVDVPVSYVLSLYSNGIVTGCQLYKEQVLKYKRIPLNYVLLF